MKQDYQRNSFVVFERLDCNIRTACEVKRDHAPIVKQRDKKAKEELL